jgi:hypothetical protein
LIKIDTEGFEEKILSSSKDLINKFKPVLSLEIPYSNKILNKFYDLGYSPYYIIDSKLIQARNLKDTKYKKRGNLVLIHNNSQNLFN